jgi:hypothetical protein
VLVTFCLRVYIRERSGIVPGPKRGVKKMAAQEGGVPFSDDEMRIRMPQEYFSATPFRDMCGYIRREYPNAFATLMTLSVLSLIGNITLGYFVLYLLHRLSG